MIIDKLWVTTKEAKERYGHGNGWWWAKARSGVINAKLGKRFMYEVASIEAYLNNEVTPTKQGDKELEQLTRQASVLGKKVEVAKSTRELATINAGMSVEQLQEKERGLGEAMLEMELLMANMVKIKEKRGIDFGDEFTREWDKFASLLEGILGKENIGEETE